MKAMKYTALAAALILMMGCATTFRPWKLSEIQEGMDRAQVVQLLGEPDFVDTTDGAEFLHYSYSENYNPPLADDTAYDRRSSIGIQTRPLKPSDKQYRYVVKLVDGKVQDYKELRN